MKQKTFQSLMLTLCVVLVILVGLSVFYFASNPKSPGHIAQGHIARGRSARDGVVSTIAQDENKVCMTLQQYDILKNSNKATCKQEIIAVETPPHRHHHHHHSHYDPLAHVDRDIRVLKDPLYPPLNRTDRETFDRIEPALRPIATSDSHDTFRVIGYLKSTSMDRDAGGNTWKLFGRMKDRHTGEFYITPANNLDDIKIPLTPEIVTGQRLRDVDTVPNELTFRSPLLNNTPYTFVELPKSQLPSRYM